MTEQGEAQPPQQPVTESNPERDRFLIELEFVQSLALPQYLTRLAQLGYFDDPAFLNYLKYLQYWKRPEYAKFVIYPHALHFLDLLQNESFRQHIKADDVSNLVHNKQYYHFYSWTNLEVRNSGGPIDPVLEIEEQNKKLEEQQKTEATLANGGQPSSNGIGISAVRNVSLTGSVDHGISPGYTETKGISVGSTASGVGHSENMVNGQPII